MDTKLWGYMGKILRVDLTDESIQEEPLETEMVEKYMGGSGFGVEYHYREVLPGVEWDDPRNRIIMASGPAGSQACAPVLPFTAVHSRVVLGVQATVSSQATGTVGSSRMQRTSAKLFR